MVQKDMKYGAEQKLTAEKQTGENILLLHEEINIEEALTHVNLFILVVLHLSAEEKIYSKEDFQTLTQHVQRSAQSPN